MTKATKARKNYYVGHCPVHSDKNKSFSIAWENDTDLNPLVHCHAGCSQKEVIEFLKNNNLWDRKEPMVSNKIAPILERGMVVEKSSPWDLYLMKRRIFVDDTVEFFGAEDFHEETQKKELCVVFPTTNLWGDYVGCQRIFIDDLGNKLRVENAKKFLGDLAGSSAKFGDRDDVSELHITEGIETGLSVYNAINRPTWAMITSNNLKFTDLPKGMRELHIWADLDRSAVGQDKADELAKEVILKLKIPVYVHLPEEVNTDWNDEQNSIMIKERYKNDGLYYFKTMRDCLSGDIVTDMDIPKTVKKLDDFFTESSEYSDMPRAFVAMPFFTAMSTLISNRLKVVSPFDGYKYIPSFWSCIIAPPSVRKTTALSKGMSGLKNLVSHKEKLAISYKAAKAEEIRLLSREIKHMKKLIEKSEDPIAMEKKLITLEVRFKALMEPTEYHDYIVNNTTIERLLKDMSDKPGAYLLESGELSSWLAMLEKDYQAGSRGIYLDLYSGIKDYTHKRMNKDSNIKIKHGSCNVTGTAQPQSIFPYLKSMGADGLFQRFQGVAVLLKSHLSEVKTVDVKPQHQGFVNDLFIWLDDHMYNDLTLDLNSQVIALEFERYKRRLVHSLEEQNNSGIASHIGKTDTSFMALAAIFHAIKCFENKVWTSVIRPEECQVAFEVSKYLIDRIRLCYVASESKDEFMTEIMGDIESGRHGEEFNHSDIYYNHYRRRSKHNFELTMEELCRRNFLIKSESHKGSVYFRPVDKMREVAAN